MSWWTIIGLGLMGIFLFKAFLSAPKKSGKNESAVNDFNPHDNADNSGID